MIYHWADGVVKGIISEKGDKEKYVCAAGITPSGTVHIGNFREIITVDLVCRALKLAGKEARFIYSWDNFDVFRKVPKNMPKQEMLKEQLRKPIVDVPDPYGEEENYARHNEVEVEESIAKVGIKPEFIYQAQKYRNNDYVKGIKTALDNKDKIKSILDKYRKEPLAENWIPLTGFCPECHQDRIEFSKYDGDYNVNMKCLDCDKEFNVDIREQDFLKLPWRVDWPMRWAYEKVDFEPGGKDHSTEGGSYSTGGEIVKLYDWTAPSYQMYDFIRIKGGSGKISSSTGDVVTLNDCLEIYEPEIVRWLFAGTRPNTEFAISFDLDVIKIYEDFDKCERIYYEKEDVKEKDYLKQKRIYELSTVDEPADKMPFQPSFRHLTDVLLAHELDVDEAVEYYKDELKTDADERRLRIRAKCAINWLERYAPEDFKYEVQKDVPADIDISDDARDALKDVAELLDEKEWSGEDLHNEFYEIMRKHDVKTKEFFKSAYKVLIDQEKGPMLANFILTIGQDRVKELFGEL